MNLKLESYSEPLSLANIYVEDDLIHIYRLLASAIRTSLGTNALAASKQASKQAQPDGYAPNYLYAGLSGYCGILFSPLFYNH